MDIYTNFDVALDGLLQHGRRYYNVSAAIYAIEFYSSFDGYTALALYTAGDYTGVIISRRHRTYCKIVSESDTVQAVALELLHKLPPVKIDQFYVFDKA